MNDTAKFNSVVSFLWAIADLLKRGFALLDQEQKLTVGFLRSPPNGGGGAGAARGAERALRRPAAHPRE